MKKKIIRKWNVACVVRQTLLHLRSVHNNPYLSISTPLSKEAEKRMCIQSARFLSLLPINACAPPLHRPIFFSLPSFTHQFACKFLALLCEISCRPPQLQGILLIKRVGNCWRVLITVAQQILQRNNITKLRLWLENCPFTQIKTQNCLSIQFNLASLRSLKCRYNPLFKNSFGGLRWTGGTKENVFREMCLIKHTFLGRFHGNCRNCLKPYTSTPNLSRSP